MRLLITGASGFVGAKTLELALADGHEVAATVRPQSPALRLAPFAGRYEQLKLELGDRPALNAALAKFRPELEEFIKTHQTASAGLAPLQQAISAGVSTASVVNNPSLPVLPSPSGALRSPHSV